MYTTIGERLSYCRSLLGLSRRELVEAIEGISLPTLSRWELNYTEIPKLKLEKLINFFNQNGIEVSADWVNLRNDQAPINKNLQNIDHFNFDDLAYLTLSTLKNNIQGFEIYQLNSNFFEPVLYTGDYIGGVINSNMEMMTNKLCYIVQNKNIFVGIFNFERMAIINLFKQVIQIEPSTSIGVVTWMAKRQ